VEKAAIPTSTPETEMRAVRGKQGALQGSSSRFNLSFRIKPKFRVDPYFIPVILGHQYKLIKGGQVDQ